MENKPKKVTGNQYQPDPRQSLFLSHYLNPKSETFSNALQSALKAGYSQEYAESITAIMPDWLSEALGKQRMLRTAEKNLLDIMEMDVEVGVKVGEEEIGKKIEPSLVGHKLKASMFIAERLGKEKYATRTEHTGAEGKPIPILHTLNQTNVLNNDSDQEDSVTEEENQGNTRRDISLQDHIDTPILDSLSPDGSEEDAN